MLIVSLRRIDDADTVWFQRCLSRRRHCLYFWLFAISAFSFRFLQLRLWRIAAASYFLLSPSLFHYAYFRHSHTPDGRCHIDVSLLALLFHYFIFHWLLYFFRAIFAIGLLLIYYFFHWFIYYFNIDIYTPDIFYATRHFHFPSSFYFSDLYYYAWYADALFSSFLRRRLCFRYICLDASALLCYMLHADCFSCITTTLLPSYLRLRLAMPTALSLHYFHIFFSLVSPLTLLHAAYRLSLLSLTLPPFLYWILLWYFICHDYWLSCFASYALFRWRSWCFSCCWRVRWFLLPVRLLFSRFGHAWYSLFHHHITLASTFIDYAITPLYFRAYATLSFTNIDYISPPLNSFAVSFFFISDLLIYGLRCRQAFILITETGAFRFVADWDYAFALPGFRTFPSSFRDAFFALYIISVFFLFIYCFISLSASYAIDAIIISWSLFLHFPINRSSLPSYHFVSLISLLILSFIRLPFTLGHHLFTSILHWWVIASSLDHWRDIIAIHQIPFIG